MRIVLSQVENVSSKHATAFEEGSAHDESDQAINLEELSPDEMVELKEIWATHAQTLSIILDTPDSPATHSLAKNWMNTAVKIGNALAAGVKANNDA
jgi:hypothetical protein